MKKFLFIFVVVALTLCSLPKRLAAEDDNPTGVAGVYNGNVSTAGNYDPHTGNAMRICTDLNLPSTSAYPLKWTRYFNSRSNPCSWTFSYQGYGLSLGSKMAFPDGRIIEYWGLQHPPDPTGIEERMGTWNGQGTIFLADGGKVVCGVVNGSTGLASQLIDPYGQITTFTRDAKNRLIRVTEPGGRYLQINWNNPGGYEYNSQITSVQAFDGIPGHTTPIETVSYTWGPFNTNPPNGQIFTVLYGVTYGDGTSAAYTYASVATDSSQPSPRKAVLGTCDDARFAGPMRQISYTVGNKGKVTSEKNFVTAEAVSTLSGITGLTGGANPVETRGDGPTRSFTYPPYNPTNPLDEPEAATFGKLLTYTDFFAGHTTTLDYELFGDSPSYGFIKKVTDPNGHSTSYTRQTGSWGITKITHDVDGSHIDQTFWPNNSQTQPYYLASRTDELGHTTTYARDGNNRITRKDYPTPDVTPLDPTPQPVYETFDYSNNPFGLVGSHRLTNGATESFTYDSRGLKTSWTDGSGNITTYAYYTSGPWMDRLQSVTKQANISGQVQVETYEYDKTFVSGVDTGAACPGRGIVTKITHTDGSYISYTHNKWGDVLTTTDELGHTTTNTYDDYGRVLTTTTPLRFVGDTLNHTTTMSYVPWGKTSSKITTSKLPFVVTFPSGKKTNAYYDGNWRKTRVQQAPGVVGEEANSYLYYDVYAGYTSIGQLLATQDPRNYVTKYHYDTRDRQDQITDALGASLGDPLHTTFFTFDYHGNKLTETHPKPDANTNPEVITFQYDKLNRVKTKITKRSDTITDTVNMAYDTGSNLWKFQDEDAFVRADVTNIYVYTYDGANRKWRTTYPNVLYEESLYDLAGNVKTYRNRNAKTQSFTYDNRNRATNFSWDDGMTSSQNTVYDLASRVTQVTNSISTINYTYFNDNLLNTEEEWTSQYSDNVHRTKTYTYDADGNRANVQYPSLTAFNYTYTNRNQVASIRPGLSGGTAIVSYTYDTSGNITGVSRDNATSTAINPDAVNRPISVVHTLVGGTKRFDYGYNNVNDITVVQRDLDLGDGYKYDLTQEITDYFQNGTVNFANGTVSNPAVTNNMLFDGCGNRTTLNSVNQSFNNMNQLSTVPGSLEYDNDGDLKLWNGWTYIYDAQNRLTSASKGTTTMEFYYDGKNRQIARRLNGTTITYSVWDDWELIEEYTTGNVATAKYLQGAHGPIKSLISNIFYYYQDSLGSTSHIADSSGALLEYYKYDLYGKPTYWNAGGTQIPATLFAVVDLFAGERYVTELALYDDRNRFMSPDLGRFLQPDPIGFKGDGSNLYRYCGNDWANRADPMGLLALDTMQHLDIININHQSLDVKAAPPPSQPGQSTPEELRSQKEFQRAQQRFDASKAEANNNLDAKLRRLGVKDYIGKMFEVVKKDPGYFHDVKFIRSVVSAISKAFLDNRINMGTSAQFQGSYAKSTMLTIGPANAKVTYANPDNMPKRADMPMHLGHEGYHQLIHGQGLRFEEAAINGPGYELGSRLGAPSARRYTPEQIRSFYPGMPGFESEGE